MPAVCLAIAVLQTISVDAPLMTTAYRQVKYVTLITNATALVCLLMMIVQQMMEVLFTPAVRLANAAAQTSSVDAMILITALQTKYA